MPTVDNKIVQMTFKNEQFERGVKESLHSLEALKKALDLDKSSASLQNLEKIAGSFDLSGISKSIDSIADRFSLLGNIGQEIFHRISKTAVDAMQSVWHTITSMPKAGMNKYEQKNKSIQMIQSAMPEKSIEEIEKVLADLNDYTDLTSYDFSTMANSIGKFVSAGVDLEVAEKVMEGIANETASAGGEIQQANIAMYNFSQALAAGSVKLMDWRSIQNQNLDTKEFKEQIIETAYELGTLQKVGEKVGRTAKGTLVDFQSLPQTLSQGWFTSDVMIKVFEKYADRTSDVGKKGFEAAKIAITWTQAMEAVKDAISTGWMTSFGYIFGNLEEAGELFTRVSDALIDFTSQISNLRNELLKGWHDGGEDGISGYQLMIEGLSNSWAILMGIVEGAKKAFGEVFGALESSGLIDITRAFAEYTQRIKEFFGFWTETKTTVVEYEETVSGIAEWTKDLGRGMRDSDANGEIMDMQKNLLALKNDLVKLDKYGADGIFGPETQAAVKAFQKSVGLEETGIYDRKTRDALEKALYPNGKTIKKTQEIPETIEHVGEGVELVSGALKGVFSIAKAGLNIMGLGIRIVGRIVEMLTPVASGLISIASALGNTISFVVEFVSSLLSGENALNAFNVLLEPVVATLKLVGGFLDGVGRTISQIVDLTRSGLNLDEISEALRLNPLTSRIGPQIVGLIQSVQNAFANAAPVFEAIRTTLAGVFSMIGQWASGTISRAVTAIGTFFTNLWTSIRNGDYLTKILKGIGTALQIILGLVGGAVYGLYSLGKTIADGATTLFNFVKNSEFVQNALHAIAEFTKPVREFFSSVWESLTAISGKLSSFKSFKDVWTAFLTALKNNPIGKKFVPVFQNAMNAVSNLRKRIEGFVYSVRTAFRSLRSFKDPQKALEMLMLNPEKNAGAIKLIQFLMRVKSLFEGIRSAGKGLFDKVAPKVSSFAQSIGKAVGDFFGGDGKSPLNKIADGFNGLKGGLKGALERIGSWFSSFVKTSPFMASLVDFGKMVRDAVVGFFGADVSGIEGLANQLKARLAAFNPVIEWFKEKFKDVKAFITDPDKLLVHVANFFSGIVNFVIGILKKLDLETLWDVTKVAFGMYIMKTIAKSIKSFSESFSVLTGASDEEEGFADKLRSIAITIAIVTAALAAMAFIPAGQALAGVAVMTVALGAVVGALAAMNKWAPKTEGIGKGILDMALSIGAVILALAGAIALIKGHTGADLFKGLGLVAGILVALGGVAWAMNYFGKEDGGEGSTGTAWTILAMCAGLTLIIDATKQMIKLINSSNPGSLAVGLGLIVLMLAGLGFLAIQLTKAEKDVDGESSSSVATVIVAMTMTLGTIIRAVKSMVDLFNDNNPWAVIGSFAMVEALLASVGAIAILLTKFSGEAEGWNVLAAVAPIVAMGYVMEKIVNVMATAIQSISGVDPTIVISFMAGAVAALGIAGASVVAFSKINFGALAKAALGIVLVLGAIGLGLDIAATFASDAMDKMSNAIQLVGWRLEDFSGSTKNIDTAAIESVMNMLTQTLIPGIGEMVKNASTIESAVGVATNVWRFGTALQLFGISIKDITPETTAGIKQLPSDIKETIDAINAIEGIDEANDVLMNIGGALSLYYGDLRNIMTNNGTTEVSDVSGFDINTANQAFQDLANLTLTNETIEKIKSFATGGTNDLNNFASGIENLGTALKDYGEKITTIDEGKVETANGILDKVMDIDDHLNPVQDFPFEVLKDKRQTINDFGLDIAALGGALAQYGDSVTSLNLKKVLMGNYVMDAVAKLQDLLPKTGGLWSMLAGEKSLGKFAGNMSDLGKGMASYANEVSSAKFDNVTASIEPIKAIAEAQSIIQTTGGLKEVLAGAADLGSLGEGLVKLGPNLATFATASDGIKNLKKEDFEKIGWALEPVKILAEAQSKIQREGGFAEVITGSANLANLGAGLKGFLDEMKGIDEDLDNFDPNDERLQAITGFLERLAVMNSILNRGNYEYNYGDLGTSFNGLMWQIENFMNGTGLDFGQMASIDNVYAGLKPLIDGLSTKIGEDTAISDAFGTMLGNVSTKFSEYVDDFETVGRNIDAGLQNGIENQESKALVIAAATAVALDAYTAAKNALGIESPSKAFEWIGEMTSTGFANGISDYSDLAGRASENLGQAAMTAIQNRLGIHSESQEGNWLGNMFDLGIANGEMENLDLVETASEAVGNVMTSVLSSATDKINDFLGLNLDDPVITPIIDTSNVEGFVNNLGNMFTGETIKADASISAANSVALGAGTTIIQGGTLEVKSEEILNRLDALDRDIVAMGNAMANLRVVMYPNALVGQIIGPIDRALGSSANRS